MHKVEDLIVWKKSIQLAKEIYLLCAKIPTDEKFGIISQIKRCSVSIPSNIAEGAGRNSNNEFKHFFKNSKRLFLRITNPINSDKRIKSDK